MSFVAGSAEQRLAALERANEVRSDRAQLKRDLKAGRRSLGPLLISPPDELLTMKLGDLLLTVPKVGRVKAHRILSRAHTSPSRTLGALTLRQRSVLLSLLPETPR